jgi:hypothetical protein
MVAAPVVSETGCDGGDGGTNSLLLGSLIIIPPLLLEDGEKNIRPISEMDKDADDTQSFFARFQARNSSPFKS